jgi:hypothetical protein
LIHILMWEPVNYHEMNPPSHPQAPLGIAWRQFLEQFF